MTTKPARPRNTAQRRSVARLAAAQALYQCDLSNASADAVLADFIQHGIGAKALVPPPDNEDGEVETPLAEPDRVMFTTLVRGTLARRDDFDRMIGGVLSADWSVERLEAVLRAILRVGAYELATRGDVPVRVVISEWMDVAKAFYSGPEPKLVNAVLDRIARVVRPEEFANDASPPG